MSRWAWAEVDLDAIRHNVEVLCAVAAPAAVWAVVKADGYGHGAVPVAGAALDGGAGGSVRRAGPGGVGAARRRSRLPDPGAQRATAVGAGRRGACRPRSDGVLATRSCEAIAAAGGREHPVHLKIDTGMHRVGAAAARCRGPCRGHRRVAGGPAGRRVHPPGRRRRARRSVQRTADRVVRRRAARHSVVARPSPAARARGQLGGDSRPSRRRASTWCAPASPSTASRPVPHSTRQPRRCGRRCRCAPGCRTSSRCSAGDRISYGLRHRFDRDATRGDAAARLRRRGAAAAVRGWRRGADRRAAPADRRRRHDGSADGRLRRRRRSPSATRSC